MRRLLMLGVVAGCTKAQPDPPREQPPVDAGIVDSLTGPRPVIVDAVPADTAPGPIDVPTLAVAGPYPSLEASCAAARPCGFLTMEADGTLGTPATTPDCTAVLDSGQDRAAEPPRAFSGKVTDLVQVVPGGELRLGGVRCALPKQERGYVSEHYVFIKRADGWWRTQTPVFDLNYNEKYCSGGIYVMWNISGARTIVGLAGGIDCMSCNKQRTSELVTELMLRIEPAGVRPRVFAPLPVGLRVTTSNPFDLDYPVSTDPDCKVGARATSLKEHWLDDTEVVLDGVSAAVGGPLTTMFSIGSSDVTQLARPGHYRFPRP